MGLLVKPDGLSSEFIRRGEGATDFARIETGLRRVNILTSGEQMTAFEDGETWRRGGGETFVADATIELTGGSEAIRHVIGKALVSFATPLDSKLGIWLRRRSFLAKSGVAVPFLYSGLDAIIFEEFIDRPLGTDDLLDPNMLDQIGKIGARLDFNGFPTLSFLSDLRTKDRRIYYVDFGFDLGEPGGVCTDRARATIEKSIPASHVELCLTSYNANLLELKGAEGNCLDLPPE